MTTKKTNSIKGGGYRVSLSFIVENLSELGWEYQRMGRSGRQVFDEIHQLLGTIPEGEVYMEI